MQWAQAIPLQYMPTSETKSKRTEGRDIFTPACPTRRARPSLSPHPSVAHQIRDVENAVCPRPHSCVSASARFCRQPSADVRRRAAPHCQFYSRASSRQSYPLVLGLHPTPPLSRGGGCLCLERGFATHALFRVTYCITAVTSIRKKNQNSDLT